MVARGVFVGGDMADKEEVVEYTDYHFIVVMLGILIAIIGGLVFCIGIDNLIDNLYGAKL